jgi:Na+/phosphate symporter
MIALSIFILIRSNKIFHKKRENEKTDELFKSMMSSRNSAEVWSLLKQHSKNTLTDIVEFAKETYSNTTDAFINEDLRTFRKTILKINTQKELLKKMRRRELIALRRIETTVAIEKNTWFHLANNSAEQMIYCLKRMIEPCKEHVDNNFNPLPESIAKEFLAISNLLEALMHKIKHAIESSDYMDYEQLFFTSNHISEEFSRLRNAQIERIRQGNNENLNVSLVYLNLLQESQELVSILRHLLRASRKFQSN